MSSLNTVVTRHPLSCELSSLIVKHISKHLNVWSDSIPDASYRINTLNDLIYIQTNSLELLDMYMRYEQPYVEYMIADELQAAEEEYMWLEQAA